MTDGPLATSVARFREILRGHDDATWYWPLTGTEFDIRHVCEKSEYFRFDSTDVVPEPPGHVLIARVEWLGRRGAIATIATLDTYVYWMIGHFTVETIAVARTIADAEINYDVLMGHAENGEAVRLTFFGPALAATIQRYRELGGEVDAGDGGKAP